MFPGQETDHPRQLCAQKLKRKTGKGRSLSESSEAVCQAVRRKTNQAGSDQGPAVGKKQHLLQTRQQVRTGLLPGGRGKATRDQRG